MTKKQGSKPTVAQRWEFQLKELMSLNLEHDEVINVHDCSVDVGKGLNADRFYLKDSLSGSPYTQEALSAAVPTVEEILTRFRK